MSIDQATKYISETLHQQIKSKPWEDEKSLPLVLRENYSFYLIEVFNTKMLLMEIRNGKALTPSVLEKQIQMLKKHWADPICICQDSITLYTRKRLIEKQIQFVVPGTHLYLPCLGAEMREYFKAPQVKNDYLSPSAQSIFIYILERGLTDVSSKDITAAFDLSLMSVTRSFGELTAHGLCEKTGTRKQTVYIFDSDKQSLWDKAEKLLRTPVQKKLWINELPVGVKAFASGLDALSEYSDIVAGKEKTFAVSGQTAKDILSATGVEQLPYAEPGAVEMEIWRYDPAFTARGEIVDPRSLYLNFTTDIDERVSMAKERMKEQW